MYLYGYNEASTQRRCPANLTNTIFATGYLWDGLRLMRSEIGVCILAAQTGNHPLLRCKTATPSDVFQTPPYAAISYNDTL
jgi:hypothetical protein